VLADHSVVGMEARIRIAALDAVDTVITDLGTLPSHRMELAAANIRVIIADDDEEAPRIAVA
jgi:DeoR/GlpR family transcriptional regulator of sugar metabolism